MAPIGTRSIVPFRFRDSFFRDPYFSDCWDTIERQRRQFERDCDDAREKVFGRSTSPFSSSILDRPATGSSLVDYYKSDRLGSGTSALRNLGLGSENSSALRSVDNDFKTEKDSYKVVLDVHQFKPEELCVKTSDDNNTIIIEGKHEDKKEESTDTTSSSGYISRQFTRKYTLPKDVKLDQLQCNLSADGVLQVTAPRTVQAITDGTTTASTTTTSGLSGFNGTAANTSGLTGFNNTLSSSTNSSAANTNGTTEQSNYRNNYSSKQESRETMTVDGRKIEPHDTSKYDSYAKWRESRGNPGLDDFDNFTSSKLGERNDRSSAFTSSKHFDDFESRLAHRMRDWDRSDDWDPFFKALPDFDMVPFWKRRSDHRLFQREREIFGDKSDADNFKVLVDAKQFAPEELSVRCTDRFVIIEGKHEEKEDPYGSFSRHFTRKYDLPQGVKAEDVQCNLKESGVLEIKAARPKPKLEFSTVGRKVPIQMNTYSNSNSNSLNHKIITEENSSSNIRNEKLSDSLYSSRTSAEDEEQKRLREQEERNKRQESVESSASTATGGRRVTIQELSRSSSANSAYNTTANGEHVIPITIAAH